MLVLSRHREESIMIGDNVEIKIVSIGRNEIELGITAPKSVPVYRREVYERISEEKDRSSIRHQYPCVRIGDAVTVNI